jgi:hypothetical protein
MKHRLSSCPHHHSLPRWRPLQTQTSLHRPPSLLHLQRHARSRKHLHAPRPKRQTYTRQLLHRLRLLQRDDVALRITQLRILSVRHISARPVPPFRRTEYMPRHPQSNKHNTCMGRSHRNQAQRVGPQTRSALAQRTQRNETARLSQLVLDRLAKAA